MPMRKLKEFLDAVGADYITTHHRPSYTASDTAHTCHIPGMNLAKTVVVRMNGELAMTVLPAHYMLDIFKLREFTMARSIKMAREEEFLTAFPECEEGAMPPFGNLFGMQVFAEESLSEDINISFNAGSHTEVITMPFTQWQNLVHPFIANIHSDKY